MGITHVFVPRINHSLEEFVRSWNNYPIRTAGHKSPQQLFTAGCLLLQNSHIPALDFFNTVDERYGIDLDGPVVLSDGISIPRSNLKFSAADMALLEQHIDPQSVTDNYGIDLYEQTLQIFHTLSLFDLTTMYVAALFSIKN